MQEFDGWVLGKCTIFSHWLQRNTGLTNFFIAKMGVFVVAFSVLVRIVSYWFDLPGVKVGLFSFFIYIILIVLSVIDVHQLNKNEERLYQNKAFFRTEMSTVGWRLMWLFMSVASIHHIFVSSTIFEFIAFDFFDFGMTIFLYFSSVTPLPPGISKLGKFVEGFANSFRKTVPTASMNHTPLM